jgi:hypothetical protein
MNGVHSVCIIGPTDQQSRQRPRCANAQACGGLCDDDDVEQRPPAIGTVASCTDPLISGGGWRSNLTARIGVLAVMVLSISEAEDIRVESK